MLSARIAAIPQSRDHEGLILDMELWENLLLAPAIRREMDRSGLQNRRGAMALCARLIERFGIRASGPRQKAAALVRRPSPAPDGGARAGRTTRGAGRP